MKDVVLVCSLVWSDISATNTEGTTEGRIVNEEMSEGFENCFFLAGELSFLSGVVRVPSAIGPMGAIGPDFGGNVKFDHANFWFGLLRISRGKKQRYMTRFEEFGPVVALADLNFRVARTMRHRFLEYPSMLSGASINRKILIVSL